MPSRPAIRAHLVALLFLSPLYFFDPTRSLIHQAILAPCKVGAVLARPVCVASTGAACAVRQPPKEGSCKGRLGKKLFPRSLFSPLDRPFRGPRPLCLRGEALLVGGHLQFNPSVLRNSSSPCLQLAASLSSNGRRLSVDCCSALQQPCSGLCSSAGAAQGAGGSHWGFHTL